MTVEPESIGHDTISGVGVLVLGKHVEVEGKSPIETVVEFDVGK